MRVRGQLAALAALVVRVEVEAALVGALQQHHPRGRAAVGRRGCERHRLRDRDARVLRLAEPALELAQRVRIEARFVHGTQCSAEASTTLRPWPQRGRSTLRTAIPGPRSQELLERKERVIANAKTIALPIVAHEGRGADAHRRRRQRLHRLHGRRRLPQRRPLAPAGRRGRAGAAGALRPHRLHDRPVRELHRARRAAARERARFAARRKAALLQRRHRGGRERGQVRAASTRGVRR